MGNARPREEKATAGLLLMALAVTFFTCIDTSAKWLILCGLPALQVVFARYAGHFLIGLALYLPQEGKAALRSNAGGKQLLRSVFLMGSTLCNFTALQYLPLTITTTVMFAGPVVVTLLSVPILKEKVGLRRLLAVLAGFCGVVIAIQPWGAEFHPAMFFSLGALMTASLYMIMTRMLAGVEANSTQQIWSSGIAAAALCPFVLAGWQWPDAPLQWVIFLAIGLLGACGHICATIAHRWADASLLAPVIYIQIFQASFAGVLVFDTWPTVWTLGGGLVIIGSGLYIWQRERHLER